MARRQVKRDRQRGQRSPIPRRRCRTWATAGIYVFAARSSTTSRTPFVDWAQDVFPALLEQDVSFYGHEITDYWNDVGSMEEFRQGNFDALAGKVRLHLDEELDTARRENGLVASARPGSTRTRWLRARCSWAAPVRWARGCG